MDQEILDLLLSFDNELAVYRKGDQNGRFFKFMAKKNMKDHRVLPTTDGSIVVGPRGDLSPSNTYLVKYPNNGYYIGPLSGQNRHGFGYRTYADPELVYVGDYVNNLKSGKGKLWSRKEKRWVYDGNWANDLKNGYGEMWKNGVTYKGNWMNDKLDGIGRMDWPSGQNYEGSFARDLRNGEGVMTYPNGDQYSGGWRNGRPHGKGGYMWKNGEVYNGTWTDGVMDGNGEIDYGIPVKGMGSVRMGSVQELNYQLQRPADWQESVTKSSQFIKSYREAIIPDSVRKSLKVDVTSSVGAAGFGGKPAPSINYSIGPSNDAKFSANTGSYNVSTTGYNYNTGSSNVGYNVGGGNAGYTVTTGNTGSNTNYTVSTNNLAGTTNYTQTTTGNTYLGIGSDVKKTSYAVGPAGIEKYEGKVETVKTAPTGTYNNNPLNYVDPEAAAKAHIDKNATSGSYTVSTNALKSNNAAVVTTTTNNYAAGTETFGSKVQKFGEDVKDKFTGMFKGSGTSYDVKTDGYNSNVGGVSDGYKVSTGSYQVAGPGRVEFGSSNDGNLRIGRSDLNSENIAINANRQGGNTYTTSTTTTTYGTGTQRVAYN